MALVSHHPQHLLGLRFPLRLRVTVRQGFVTLHNEIATRKLGSGDSFVVPAFLRFACDVMPGRGKPAVFSLALEQDEAEPAGRPRLARQALEPRAGAAYFPVAAGTMDGRPPGRAVAGHAAQGALAPVCRRRSLASLVREQRLAHALHTAAQAGLDEARGLAEVAAGSGFASVPAFCDACTDVAGVRPSLFLRAPIPPGDTPL